MDKKVAMHQPNYVPWLGYFYKMAKCDYFVYLDGVQYPRGQSFAARNRIKTTNGAAFLTIPVRSTHGHEGKVLYSEIECADSKWKDKHLKTIEFNYKRARYFPEIFSLYETQLKKTERFMDININLIEAFANYLDIKSERLKLSQILPHFGQKTQLIIDICKRLGANIYLSGEGGGRDYNDPVLLTEHNIQLEYTNFNHPEYQQLWGEFVSHLSVIDLLFNHGPASKEILFYDLK
jgi:hypothetical protein